MKIKDYITIFLSIVMSITGVYAVSTGIQPINNLIEMISRLFNISALQNSDVQMGFIRFGMFLMVFSLSYFFLRKNLDQKPAGIVSFVISFTGAALMPKNWVLSSGGVFASIMSMLVPLLVVIVGGYFALVKLKIDEGDGKSEKIFKNMISILLLLAVMLFIEMYIVGGALLGFLLINNKMMKRYLRWR